MSRFDETGGRHVRWCTCRVGRPRIDLRFLPPQLCHIPAKINQLSIAVRRRAEPEGHARWLELHDDAGVALPAMAMAI